MPRLAAATNRPRPCGGGADAAGDGAGAGAEPPTADAAAPVDVDVDVDAAAVELVELGFDAFDLRDGLADRELDLRRDRLASAGSRGCAGARRA